MQGIGGVIRVWITIITIMWYTMLLFMLISKLFPIIHLKTYYTHSFPVFKCVHFLH